MSVVVRRRWILLGASALALSAGAGVLTAHLDEVQATGEHPPEFDRLLAEVPPYPDAYFYPLGKEMQVDGTPREMGYAVTRDPPDKVADRYEGIWTSRGFHVERRTSAHEQWVIATDPTDPVIRTVVVSDDDTGRTAIVASVSDKGAVQPLSLITNPPRCALQSSTGARDGHTSTEIAFLRCDGTLADVLAYYDGLLGRDGRTAYLEPTIDRKDAQVSYSSERRNVSIIATQTDAVPPTTAVSITWQEQQ